MREAFAALGAARRRLVRRRRASRPATGGIARTVDMRYAGQNYELGVPLPDGAISSGDAARRWRRLRRRARQRYGFVADGEPVQLVTFRLEATGMVPKAELAAHPDAGPDASRP